MPVLLVPLSVCFVCVHLSEAGKKYELMEPREITSLDKL